jgi:uncharacterized protein involved in type VI secretion and phage assembly
MTGRFVGKFRGVVTDIQDPLQLGRVRARVPDVTRDQDLGWAMPCFPFAGSHMGFFALPKKGAGVWIEFEQGDPDYPIWVGCWYGTAAEVPTELLAPPYKKTLLKTEQGNSITLDDTPIVGGITLETAGGQRIKLSAKGIEIVNGTGAKISMQGPIVNVNEGGLEIM